MCFQRKCFFLLEKFQFSVFGPCFPLPIQTPPRGSLSFGGWSLLIFLVSETLHRPPEVCPNCLLRLPSPLAPLHCVTPQMPILFFPLSPKEAGHMVLGEETYFRDIRHHTSKTITYRLSLGPRSPGGLPLLQGDKLAALSHPNSPEMLFCP